MRGCFRRQPAAHPEEEIGVVSPVSGAGLGEMPKSDEGVRFADV
jgi:hypothetical protein